MRWPLVVSGILAFGCGSSAPKPKTSALGAGAATPARIEAVRPAPAGGAKPSAILEIMTSELDRSMKALGQHSDPAYFASYEVSDSRRIYVAATLGVLESSTDNRGRSVDIDVRVGDRTLDNTHELRDDDPYPDFRRSDHTVSARLPLEDDEYSTRSTLWLTTDRAYRDAVRDLQRVQANTKVKVGAEDPSDDFSRESPSEYFEAPATITIDRSAWEKRLKTASAGFKKHPKLRSSVSLSATAETHYYANSEGTRYQIPSVLIRVSVSGSTVARDGMQLRRHESIDVHTVDALPTDEQIAKMVEKVATDLAALGKAPVAEPYLGPAILEGKAAGVFFHEVFGHRIEGHRQKREDEGQTFSKKIGQPIMPDFIDVYDDPTIASLNGTDLNGFYRYDDEGVPAAKASLVERGVLKTFLLGRSPTRGFNQSNGHGRRSEQFSVVPRQANLVVAPARTVDGLALRQQLLDEVKKQGKPYGLVIRELDGGFTMTERFLPQSFKLLSIMVYRVYPDGREELVRGADLEGTPLRALADILAAGDDVSTFNGYCGAESGYVPVSATSTSLLIGHVEVAKKTKGQDKPPILPPPPPREGDK